MTINDHLILSPEYRESLENHALRIQLDEANGEPIDTRDSAIVALIDHIRALDARAENYARLFGNLDKLGDTLAESKEQPNVAVGRLIQAAIADVLTPNKETD